jgi:hypothetical protein
MHAVDATEMQSAKFAEVQQPLAVEGNLSKHLANPGVVCGSTASGFS